MHNEQMNLINQYINVFEDEINVMVESLPNELLLNNTGTIIQNYEYNIPIKFKGFGRVMPINEAIDEIEFHQNILSFFHLNGKILQETSQIDSLYKQRIVVSFFNIDTQEIDVIESKTSIDVEENGFAHLFWLAALQENMSQILNQLIERGQTSAKIKIGTHKFKEYITNAKERHNENTRSE